MTRTERARKLLESQRSDLLEAIRLCAADRLAACTRNRARALLAEVDKWLAQDPLAMADALKWQGENGRAPGIRDVCRDAQFHAALRKSEQADKRAAAALETLPEIRRELERVVA